MIHIKQEHFDKLRAGGKEAVIAALETAIELERSTIPPYLYALYSLDPTKNGAIAEIIDSIVIEEMLHMTLACNILNALGGTTGIADPTCIPVYPGPLPGSVETGLIVGLCPFSLDLVESTFMAIEEPEHPLEFPVEAAATGTEPLTIGAFYRAIMRQIERLPQGSFSGAPRNQIGPDQMDEAVVVTNAESALRAIGTIVEQGEGTSKSPEERVGKDVAHYYRFAEVYHGKKLIPNPDANPATPPDQRYIYGGPPVGFDQTGVLPAPQNPKAAGYPPGSAARYACDTFNYTYTNLLKSLQAVFTGQPKQLDTAIGLMMSMKQQAIDMMSGASTGGASAGPSFEYQPVN